MRKAGYLLLLIPFGLFVWIAFHSTRFEGGEDGVMHHLIARYAWQHPANFFDLWGKPLYVLLSAPFALFGFRGSLVFNILLSILSAGILAGTARKLGLANAWLAPVLLLFSTIYFSSATSAVTEILFSFVLCCAFWAASARRWILAAILVSFLPFARTEGNGIILAWAIGFLFLRQWKAVPFLLTGSLAYSLAGWSHFGNFFWVWSNHPYGDASHIYGSGPLWHYVVQTRQIWGNVLYPFWILGTVLLVAHLIVRLRKKEENNESFYVLFFLVMGSWYVFLLGHSIVWYKGWSASFGLIRVMAAAMPACVLIALYGFNQLVNQLNPNLKMLRSGLAVLMAVLAVSSAWKVNRPPYGGDKEREEVYRAADWFRETQEVEGKLKLYYSAPSVADAFGIDPFDPEQRGDLSSLTWKRDPEPGSIIFWDAHFGPNECGLPIDTLLQRPELEMIYHQVPEVPMTTLNNYNYEIYLFRTRE